MLVAHLDREKTQRWPGRGETVAACIREKFSRKYSYLVALMHVASTSWLPQQ